MSLFGRKKKGRAVSPDQSVTYSGRWGNDDSSGEESIRGRQPKKGPLGNFQERFHSPSQHSDMSESVQRRPDGRKHVKKWDRRGRDRYHDPGTMDLKDYGPPPEEAIEALCNECRDVYHIIYINPDTGQPYTKRYFKVEPCFCCGKPWPKDLSYSERMVNEIIERIQRQPGYNELVVFHDGCNSNGDRDLPEGGRDLDGPNNRAKKRALLIGIDYLGQEGQLKNCRRDIRKMKDFLGEHDYEDIVTLYEDWSKYRHPTKEEIERQMVKLIKGSREGDMLFIHFSGHGTQVQDISKDEPDGRDECIVPVDHQLFARKRDGLLVDDDLHRILTRVPPGVQLTVIFDSCHSGSALDLEYEYKDKEREMRHANQLHKYDPKDEGRVILWSGCRDGKTSADTKDGGAMSRAFIQANSELELKYQKKRTAYTYEHLYGRVHEILGGDGYRQKPALSSNDKRFDMREFVKY